MKVLVLSFSDVESLLSMDACIELMAETLAALARGEMHQPLRNGIRPPGAAGLLGLMPAYRPDTGQGAVFALKAVGVFPGNSAIGKDTHQGAVLLFRGDTGELLAVMDASSITAIRTAAVSAVATRLLANPDAGDLAIIGAGVQARSHIEAISRVRTIRRARVVSRDIAHAKEFAARMAPHSSFPIEPVRDVEAAVRGADLIVAATSASEPVLVRGWVARGAHLNVVGSSSPKAREVDSALMATSSLFVDRRESAVNEAGDYLLALRDGAIGADHIRAEIGDLLIGKAAGRSSKDEITLFKSLGLAVEDLASADYLYRRARETGAGTWVEF